MLKEATKKVDILIEALPYIRQFYGKVVVVKYGGSAVEESDLNHSILEDITFMNHVGIHPVVVHGAGPFITKRMQQAGIEVKFLDGIRYTDAAALNIVVDSLNEVNRNIVRELKGFGNEAKGFVGKNGELITAEKKKGSVDYGFVGEISGVDRKLIYSLLNAKIVPVIAPLGVDSAGQVYNLNADTVAAEVARSLDAEKLVLLTNVRGIMTDVQDPDSLISSITLPELRRLIEAGVVTGGMIPKVQACIKAAERGVRKTHIIEADILHALLLEIYTDKGIGTEIINQNA
ncbi:MAG: acetylglutamate kinase [Candidatus Omnitrophica bacterium]|nr:acetylglutamate kinase [Candidatus Omnitrophota bacterium]